MHSFPFLTTVTIRSLHQSKRMSRTIMLLPDDYYDEMRVPLTNSIPVSAALVAVA